MLAAGAAASFVLLAGCGSGSKIVPGASDAATACKSSGVHAAALAAHAAAVNPRYAVLAADEGALAASEANTEGELSDGSSADDSGLGALAGASAVGSSADNNVIRDCMTLGLSVTPG
jgi:hypothetical protein